MKKIALVFWVLLVALSCDKKSKIEKEISKIPVNVSVLRFDLEYQKARPADLPVLKSKYPYLFPEEYSDSFWIAKMYDTLQRSLFNEVAKTFPDFKPQKKELESFFKHVKYYYPSEDIPTVVTVTSDVDYNNQVFYTKNYLIIELDTYLGKNHEFYTGIQQYIAQTLDKKYMIADVASAFASAKVPKPTNLNFMSTVIWYGKKLYLESLLIPDKTEADLMEYTENEYAWAEANEGMIWQYFVENEILYSTSAKNRERFIYPAPFSKFYLPVDNESPGRLGIYTGYKIVKAYMEHNSVSLQQMLNTSEEDIFKNANYKPRK